MSKEMWIAAHEELVEEYLSQHPEADEAKAYDAVVDATQERYAWNCAGLIDRARDEASDA